MEIRARKYDFGFGLEIAIADRENRTAVKTLTMEPIPNGAYIPAALHLEMTEAQILMDSLWDCGVRPSAGQGSAGQLASIQYHLEDMRKIVFKEEKR